MISAHRLSSMIYSQLTSVLNTLKLLPLQLAYRTLQIYLGYIIFTDARYQVY